MSDEKEIYALDSQKLSMLQVCPAKFNYVFNKHYTSPETAFPLERGHLIHTGLELHHRNILEGRPTDIDAYVKAVESEAISTSVGMDDVTETIEVLREYIQLNGRDETYKFLNVEQVASRVLYEDDEIVILYEAKIDLITEIRGMILPWDTKTYSRKYPISQLDNQFIGYCWILDVRNLMINRIGFQKTLKPKDKHFRQIVSYPKTLIDDWVANTVWWIKLLRQCEKEKIWPMNLKSCISYGRPCEYESICKSPADLRDWKANSLFNIGKPWDVGATL